MLNKQGRAAAAALAKKVTGAELPECRWNKLLSFGVQLNQLNFTAAHNQAVRKEILEDCNLTKSEQALPREICSNHTTWNALMFKDYSLL